MAARLKANVFDAKRPNVSGKPIDLVHLGHQTQGDDTLENEVLSMFATQARTYLNMMTKCSDVTTRIRAAHSLKGASRSIGAFRLAELAEAVERVRHSGYGAVEEEVDRVIRYIDELR